MDTTLLAMLVFGAVLAAMFVAVLVLLVSTRRELAGTAERSRAAEIAAAELPKKVLEEVRAPLAGEVEALRERLDGSLERLAVSIAEVSGGLAALREAVAAIELVPAPCRAGAEVAPLLSQAVDTLEARLGEIGGELAVERVLTVEESVGRVLRDRGFTDVVLLEGPEREGERAKVTVTARRDGMTYKGPVLLDGARVVEQRLRPSYPMFP